MDKLILDLLDEARNSIGNFCIEKCHSQCCKTGFLLLLNEDEIDIVCGKNRNLFFENKILTPSDMGLGYKFDFSKASCRYLGKNYKCEVHSGKRPKVRCDFPIFKAGDTIIFADSCLAVKEGLLEKYKKNLEELGIKVI